MEVLYVSHPIQTENKKPEVMAMGFFDGIHLGHQELLLQAKSIAERKDAVFSVMTFDPHPMEVLTGKARKFITPLPEKIAKMEKFGVEKMYIMHFDKNFASLEPDDFVLQYIIGMKIKHVVVGFDFTFGKKAKGTVADLRSKSEKGVFELSVIPKKTYKDQKISSTIIRNFIQEGKVELIPYCLGASYSVKVTTQYNYEKSIIEMRPASNFLIPLEGFYFVEIINGQHRYTCKLEIVQDNKAGSKLVIHGLVPKLYDECEIVFLNRIAKIQSLTV